MSQDKLFIIHVQTQGCELFYFLIKRVDVFTNGCLYSLPRGLGRAYVQIEKAIYSLKNKKLKRKLYTIWKK